MLFGLLIIAFANLSEFFSCAEQKRYAPDTREGNDCIDYSAEKGVSAAAYPSDKVESKKTDATPVQRADYSYYQRNSVHYHFAKASFKTVFRLPLVLTSASELCYEKLASNEKKCYFALIFTTSLRTCPLLPSAKIPGA